MMVPPAASPEPSLPFRAAAPVTSRRSTRLESLCRDPGLRAKALARRVVDMIEQISACG